MKCNWKYHTQATKDTPTRRVVVVCVFPSFVSLLCVVGVCVCGCLCGLCVCGECVVCLCGSCCVFETLFYFSLELVFQIGVGPRKGPANIET